MGKRGEHYPPGKTEKHTHTHYSSIWCVSLKKSVNQSHTNSQRSVVAISDGGRCSVTVDTADSHRSGTEREVCVCVCLIVMMERSIEALPSVLIDFWLHWGEAGVRTLRPNGCVCGTEKDVCPPTWISCNSTCNLVCACLCVEVFFGE